MMTNPTLYAFNQSTDVNKPMSDISNRLYMLFQSDKAHKNNKKSEVGFYFFGLPAGLQIHELKSALIRCSHVPDELMCLKECQCWCWCSPESRKTYFEILKI